MRLSCAPFEDAIASSAGVLVLRSEMDTDHNRSVITFAGPPDAVSEGALRGIAVAVERIDLRKHPGVHPRMGAADVVPFVPLEGSTLADCVAIARRTGEEVWKRLGVPVYFYEAAAMSPDRRLLENCRRGGFENPNMAPDLGGPALHPSAGACIIGARKMLIAFNINLQTDDVAGGARDRAKDPRIVGRNAVREGAGAAAGRARAGSGVDESDGFRADAAACGVRCGAA